MGPFRSLNREVSGQRGDLSVGPIGEIVGPRSATEFASHVHDGMTPQILMGHKAAPGPKQSSQAGSKWFQIIDHHQHTFAVDDVKGAEVGNLVEVARVQDAPAASTLSNYSLRGRLSKVAVHLHSDWLSPERLEQVEHESFAAPNLENSLTGEIGAEPLDGRAYMLFPGAATPRDRGTEEFICQHQTIRHVSTFTSCDEIIDQPLPESTYETRFITEHRQMTGCRIKETIAVQRQRFTPAPRSFDPTVGITSAPIACAARHSRRRARE
jgi:hypothetical protein